MALLIAVAIVVAGVFAAVAAHAQAPPPAETGQAPEIVPPKLITEPSVEYPEGASGDARVTLVIVVDETGAVSSAEPVEEKQPFSGRARAAAYGFRFEPATRNGKPIAARILLEVVFKQPKLEPSEHVAGATPSEGASEVPEEVETEPAPREPAEVVVHGERAEPSRSVTLSRAEVRQIPGAFGDPFRAIEIMPGVTPIVSGLPFFFVRGAPPGNVGYFLDGVRVPLLFHVGVGPSVIHPALMDRVDLYPGGYPARFGRFAGGIVAGETLAPIPELHGEYNVRLFDAGLLAEAPFADGRGTVLLGGRYSYTGLLLTLLQPNTILEYWDYQARASYDLTHDDRVSVFGFGSYDFVGQKVQAEPLTVFSTQFHRVDLRLDHQFGDRGRLRTAFTGGLDRSLLQEQNRSVFARLYSTRSELEYRVSRDALLRAGGDIELNTYEIDLGISDLSPSAQRIAAFFATRTDIALGTRADVVIDVDDRFELTPGLRIDLFGSEGAAAAAVDPRLATRAKVSKRLDVITTFGIAHQPPSFVVPLPGAQPGGLRGGLQRALQESAGVELDLGDGMTAGATLFQNAFFNMSDPLGSVTPEISGCPPGSFPVDTLAGDRLTQPENPGPCGIPRFVPGTLGPDRAGGGGQGVDSRTGQRAANVFEVRTMGAAYGLELLFKRQLTKKLGGLASYTLSRSVRSYGNRTYLAAFDRTHVANAAVAYDLGRRWRAGGRMVFYTGLPKAPDPTDPGATRLPPFFRVDLRLEKRWQLSEKLWIAAVAEWMNATLSTEAITTRCTLAGCEAQTIGPVTIPSLGVEGGF